MTYTHYIITGNKTRLFNVGQCETCGEMVEAPNAVWGVVGDISEYKALGMIELRYGQLPEEWFDDETGQCVCDNCG